MIQQYPYLRHDEPFLSPSKEEPLRFLIVSTCQLAPVHGALLELGHSADHLLWDNHPHTDIPDVAPSSVYDANLISFTLRHVFYQAVLDIFPEIPPQFIEIEPLWVKAVSEGRIEDFFDSCRKVIRSLFRKTVTLAEVRPTFYFTFLEPRRNYLGNLFKRYDLENITYFVQELNRYIEKLLKEQKNSYLFDVNELFSEYGRLFYQDDYFLQIAHASFIHDYEVDVTAATARMTPLTPMTEIYDTRSRLSLITHAIARRLADNVRIIKQPLAVKLIICDLDDTLWMGISGEKERLTWDEMGTWPLGLAEALLIYKARGGMLAICSKNEHEPTLEKFRQAFRDGLKIEDFASVQINFESKVDNIRRILSDVNILPQNALFIDDNPREVDEVRKAFPDIHILNAEPYDWRRKILFSPLTQVASVTDEARLRTQSVQAKIKRDDARSGASREEWLASLGIEQSYRIVDSFDHESYVRAFELLNKTNQFNTNGRRWTEEEMRDFIGSGGRIFCTFLRDKMVDSGLISAFLYKDGEILQGVLSCRVFGLSSEYATLHYLTQIILETSPTVTGSIADTGRNFTCHPLFLNAGFSASEEIEGLFVTNSITPEPPHIVSHSEMLKLPT